MSSADAYDALPYESIAFPETHPYRLGGMARLYGLNCPLPDEARVLELGCASGGNIIPMAASLPGANFTGIDFSKRQIEAGEQWINDMGLANCQLICADLSTTDIDGQFDFIIAHGVYSWVNSETRDSLLRLCRDRLAARGVAYVSFNTLPGWYQKQALRDFLLFHQQTMAGEELEFQALREAFASLANSVKPPDSQYSHMLKESLRNLETHSDSYLAHEHLEPINEAFYFNTFAAHASQFDLDYLGEAKPQGNGAADISSLNLPANTGRIEQEQYADFLSGTQFRRALLHGSQDRPQKTAGITAPVRYSCASAMTWEEDDKGRTVFSFEGGKSYVTPGLTRELLVALSAAWPEPRAPAELSAAAGAAGEMEKLALAGIAVPYLGAAGRVRGGVSDYPLCTDTARYQARTGRAITNLRHENVQLNEFQKHLLQKLDGKHHRDTLEDWLRELMKQGTLKVEGAKDSRALARELLSEQIGILAGIALLA